MPEKTVSIELVTEAIEVGSGQEFEVEVRVNAGMTKPVDTAQVYLDFDNTKLDVLSIKGGSRLRYVLLNESSQLSGHFGFAAGTTGAAQVAPFILCTVTFKSRGLGSPGETEVGFAALRAPRHTKAIHRGLNVTGALEPLLLVAK